MLHEYELRDQYETFMSTIKACINPASYEELAAQKHILLIAINEEGLIRNFFERINACGAEAEITLIAQPKMVSVLNPYVGSRTDILEWKGPYTADVVDQVHSKASRQIDAFVFFSGQKLDIRNLNLLEIADRFWERPKAFCIDSDDEVYRYDKVDLLLQAIKRYFEMDKYISQSLMYEETAVIS